jgi:hypothetical protein
VVAVCTISITKDHQLVWHWIGRNRLLHHPIEMLSSVLGASPVEPEGEFVEIEFQMLGADIAPTRYAPAKSDQSHNSGNETRLACPIFCTSEAETDNPGRPARWQTEPQTRSDFLDSPPGAKTLQVVAT